jgi:hypothetical protein
MGKDIYCPRCNNLVRYGTPACETCGATFGWVEDIAWDNAKNHTGEMTSPDVMELQFLIKKGENDKAVKLVKEIMKVNTKEAKKTVNMRAKQIGYPEPFPEGHDKGDGLFSWLFRR